MRSILLFSAGISVFIGLASCTEEPTSCFSNDRGDSVKVNLQVEFYSCSNDAETHHWDFGDGAKAENSGTAIKHVYKATGEYLIKLEVRNGSKSAVSMQGITVIP